MNHIMKNYGKNLANVGRAYELLYVPEGTKDLRLRRLTPTAHLLFGLQM